MTIRRNISGFLDPAGKCNAAFHAGASCSSVPNPGHGRSSAIHCGGRLKKIILEQWRIWFYGLVGLLLWLLVVGNAYAGQATGPHAPQKQIDEKGGVLLDESRWQVHVPDIWSAATEPPRNGDMVPLARFLSRDYTLTHPRLRGGNVWFRISLADLPENLRAGEQILEFEFPMTVVAVFARGKKLKDVTRGNTGVYRVNADAGRCFVLSDPDAAGSVEVCAADFDFRFNNLVGRVVLRPPTLLDRLLVTCRKIDKPGQCAVRCAVSNRMSGPLQGVFRMRVEDFFGQEVRTRKISVKIRPGDKPVGFVLQRESYAEYKAVGWFITDAGAESRPYWFWFRDSELAREQNALRDHQVLDWGWSARWVPQSEGFVLPLPADKWFSKFPRKFGSYRSNCSPGLPLFCGEKNIPCHRLWVKNRFRVPANLAGKRVTLHLRSVLFHARVVVNGKFVREVHNHDLPDTFDITAYVIPGRENDLALGITDYIAIRAPDAPRLKDGEHGGGHVVDAGPSLVRDVRAGLVRPPVVAIVPEVRVRRVWVKTRVQGGRRLTALTWLVNAGKTEARIRIRQSVLQCGSKILDLGSREMLLMPGAEVSDRLVRDWGNAGLWTLDHPRLYELCTEVFMGDALIDKYRERFGFCEWSMRDGEFLLNGNKVHLYGDGYGLKSDAYFWPLIPTNSRIARVDFDRQDRWLAIADEAGQAATWEIHMSPYGSMGYRLGGDLIYRNLLSKWRHIIPEDRNHPALFCYTLGNEPPTSDPGVCKKMFQHEEDVYRLDPTRLVHFSRGNELYGHSRMYSPHYLYHDHILPVDLNYINRRNLSRAARKYLEREKAISPSYEITWITRKPGKPIFDSEGVSVTDGKESVPWLFGEEMCVRRPGKPRRYTLAMRIAQDVMRGYLYEGHRRNGINAVLGHIGGRWGDQALSPVAAFMYEDDFRLRSGIRNLRRIMVLNDTAAQEVVDVKLMVFDEQGRELSSQQKTFSLGPGAMTGWEAVLPIISVNQPQYVRVVLEARGRTSGIHYRKSMRMTVFPAFVLSNFEIEDVIGIFDPADESRRILAGAGFSLRMIDRLDAKALQDLRVLVIGRNYLAAAGKSAKLINARVKEGMRVLVLSQDKLDYPFPFKLDDGNDQSFGAGCVIADPGHPVFAGLLPEDLRFFQNQERVPLVFANAPYIPVGGNIKVLAYGSKTRLVSDLAFAPLVEARWGRGIYMVSQLALTSSMAHDPVPALLLRNMLGYLQADSVPASVARIHLGTDAAACLGLRFGLDPQAASTGVADHGYTLVAATKDDGDFQLPDKLEPFVANGGVLVVHGLTPSLLKNLAENFGIRVRLVTHMSTEAMMLVRDPLFKGLTQDNWVWQRKVRYFKPRDHRQPRALDVGRQVILVEGEAEPLLEPAYMVRVKHGRGAIVLDSTRWSETGLKKARVVGFALLNNMGAVFKSSGNTGTGRDWAEYVRGFKFFPIDLTPVANRGFADPVAGDGKGGWTDEGGQGIDEIPKGMHKFNHVPFMIADPAKNNGKGLIALKGHCWSNLPAKSGEIPVHRKLDRLFLLHGCAWASLKAGAPMARYIIHYADRKNWIPGQRLPYVHVPVLNKRHIYDWWFFDKIASGEYEMSNAVIGWRSKTGARNRGIAMMEWVNPFPEREIDAIQVEALSAKAQFFLIGVTGARECSDNVRAAPRAVLVAPGDLPRELSGIKGKLWQVRAGVFTLYFDASGRVRWLGKGRQQILRELGYWYIQNRNRGRNVFVAHQSGVAEISKVTVDNAGNVVIQAEGEIDRLLCWKQTIKINSNIICVRNAITFGADSRKLIKNKSLAISSHVRVAAGILPHGGKLRQSGSGFMLLPARGYGVMVRFSDAFERFRRGVYYIEAKGSCGIAPKNLHGTIKANTPYVTEFEVEINEL